VLCSFKGVHSPLNRAKILYFKEFPID